MEQGMTSPVGDRMMGAMRCAASWLLMVVVTVAGCEREASRSTAPSDAADASTGRDADASAATPVGVAPEPVAADSPPPRDPIAESTFVLLIATKRARPLPYADAAVDFFAPLPDYTLLIDMGGLDVMHDFDHILAATPDFRDPTRTFLVAEYTLTKSDMRAALDRAVRRSGHRIEWVEHDGYVGGNPVPDWPGAVDHDPRWFVLLPDEPIGVYVPPEFLGSIVPLAEGAPRLDHVTTLRRMVGQRPDAGLQFEVDHVAQRMYGWSGLLPGVPLHALGGVSLTVQASPTPDLALTLRFLDDASAAQMLAFWDKDVPALVAGLDFAVRVFVAPLLDQTKVERSGLEIIARAQLTGPQITWVIGLVAAAALQVSSKTPADIERLRLQRRENWVRRREGKLPPAALE
jgi:hypothetical protein